MKKGNFAKASENKKFRGECQIAKFDSNKADRKNRGDRKGNGNRQMKNKSENKVAETK